MAGNMDLWLGREMARFGRWRSMRPVRVSDGDRLYPSGKVEVAGRLLRDFSSNDYLALSRDPRLMDRAAEWGRLYGCGSGGSRLVRGHLEPFARLEEKLARLYTQDQEDDPGILIFNSGYQANTAILPSLLDHRLYGARPLVFTDRLNHASLHAGIQAAGIRQIRYRHNDMEHLSELLERHIGDQGAESVRCFIVTESVFSMDGDQVDLDHLWSLAEEYQAFLYLDEAHAVGVWGRDGLGLASDDKRADLTLGSFGKALGAFGAYIRGSTVLRDFLVGRCSGFIYTTALPPGILGAVDAALDLLPELTACRGRILANAATLRAGLRELDFDCGSSTSQIIPVILGDNTDALAVSAFLEENGFLAVAIRPPTVPEGTARLRFSVTAAHDEQDIADLIALMRCVADGAVASGMRSQA